MTRKEEIKQAAKANASQMCNFCLDKYCMEVCLTCPNLHESVIAFTDGVEWADQHPKIESLWHDVSKFPNKALPIIVEIYDDIDPIYEVISIDETDDKFWEYLVSDRDITRWAYISDLLPKGGEK